MQIEWMEQIAGHLAVIADAHKRAANALERAAKSAEILAVVTLLRYHAGGLRRIELEGPMVNKLDQWARDLAEGKASP